MSELLGLGFDRLMGAAVLGILWVNVTLIAASALIEARRLRRRLNRLGPFEVATVRRGAGPDGALARFWVRQRGRARQGGEGDVFFHDQGTGSEVWGGALSLGADVEVSASAKARVWVSASELAAAAACRSPEDFAAGHAEATRARGLCRDVTVRVAAGDRVWTNARAGHDTLVLAKVDPHVWTRRRVALAVAFALAAPVACAAVTVIALWPPLFGVVSTVGGALGLGYFLALQPLGVAVRDFCRPPDRAYVRGVWRQPRGALAQGAPGFLGQPRALSGRIALGKARRSVRVASIAVAFVVVVTGGGAATSAWAEVVPDTAPGDDPLAVSLDWSGVSDRTVAACKLEGVENLLLQALLERGHAVVARVDESGVALTIREDQGRFVIEGARGDRVARRGLAIPRACDSTIQVDLQHRMLQVLAELGAPPPAAQVAPEPAAAVEPGPPRPEPISIPEPIEVQDFDALTRAERGLTLAIGPRVAIGTSGDWLAGAVVALEWPVVAGLWLGGELEGLFYGGRGLFFADPALTVAAGYDVYEGEAVRLRVGLSGAFELHVYERDDRVDLGAQPTGRLGMPVTLDLAVPAIRLAVTPFWRVLPIEHRDLAGRLLYEAGPVGFLVSVAWHVALD